MYTQLLLPGFGTNPKRRGNLFFAIMPSVRAGERIAELAACLRSEHGLRGLPLAADRLHVSLRGLGQYADVPRSLLDRACTAASTVRVPPFAARFDRAVSFSGRWRIPRAFPFVLVGGERDDQGFERLHRALSAATRQYGLRVPMVGYTPHLTLLYDERDVPEQIVEPIGWTVSEFVLIHSHLGSTRPYTVLGRWPLHTPPGGRPVESSSGSPSRSS